MIMNRIGGGLRVPAGALKEAGVRIRHNANSPKRVEVIVPALDELEVSEEVAAQLTAADPHFQAVDAPRASRVRRAGKTTEGG